MPGRTPREARDAFLEPLRQSASCVTHIPLQPSYGSDRLGFLHAVTFAGAKPVKLNTTSDRGPIYLRMRMNFAIVPHEDGYKVSTRAYDYRIDNADHSEVLSFHWHPEAHGETDFPHQHIGGAEIEPKGVLSQSRHLPSGRIAFEEVLLWCITDLKVVPRRLDWERVLRDNRDIFVTFRTWSTTPGISTC